MNQNLKDTIVLYLSIVLSSSIVSASSLISIYIKACKMAKKLEYKFNDISFSNKLELLYPFEKLLLYILDCILNSLRLNITDVFLIPDNNLEYYNDFLESINESIDCVNSNEKIERKIYNDLLLELKDEYMKYTENKDIDFSSIEVNKKELKKFLKFCDMYLLEKNLENEEVEYSIKSKSKKHTY